ncbi:MAG: hypothetical protein LUQ11_02625 [Methylococcaceae bacterium]|nr:hypothetical protein [Methylococcaceae bacterium]
MTILDQHILNKVRDRLGADRLETAIVYMDSEPKRAGERVSVTDNVIDMPWDGYIVFIDLEPKANWGHACEYLAIRLNGDEVIELAAQMPPFLKAETSAFRLLWRGPLAPEWAVAV